MQRDLKRLYIIGDIDDSAFKRFTRCLSRFESICPTDVITVELSSGGGDPYAALAFYDRIKRSQCKINIYAYGLVASAAVAILAAGDKRFMGRNAWMMVHEDSMQNDESATITELERDAKHYRRMEDQWARMLADVSPTSIKKWAALHKAETYLTAQECLALGIIEGII